MLNLCCQFNAPIIKSFFDNTKTKPQFDTILVIFTRAVEALSKLTESDALVGDQACQIRALKSALSALSLETFDFDRRAIETELENFQFLKNNSCKLEEERIRFRKEINEKISQDPAKKKELNLLFTKYINEEFNVKKNELDTCKKTLVDRVIKEDLLIAEDTLFLIRSYFLTITAIAEDGRDYPNSIKPLLIQLDKNNKQEALDITVFNAMKCALSKQSVAFVKSIAKESYSTFLTERKVFSREKNLLRVELPFFYMTKVIFEEADRKNIPILLKIRNIREKFYPCQMLFPIDADSKAGAIIIEAFSSTSSYELKKSEFKAKLLEVGKDIFTIIDYNAAQHPQFTDGQMDYDETQMKMAEAATKLGFSEENCSLCCITHVFYGTVENQRKD